MSYSRRNDVHYGDPLPPPRQPIRLRDRALRAEMELQVLLRYLASGCTQQHLAMVSQVSPSSVHMTIKYGLRHLLNALKTIPDAQIRFPDSVDECELLTATARATTDFQGLHDVIGSVDGTLCQLQRHQNKQQQEQDYSGRKHIHARDVLAFWTSDGGIASLTVARGSAHDAGIADTMLHKLNVVPGAYAFLGDSAFANSTHILRMARVNDAARQLHPAAYWRDYARIRVAAEQGNGLLKNMWQVVRGKWQVHYAAKKAVPALTCSAMLHNILVRRYGVGPVATAFGFHLNELV